MKSAFYRDQVNSLTGWFQSWNTCEQTVALCSILKKITPSQSMFLIHVLEQNVVGSLDVATLEEEANDPDYVQSLCNVSKEQAVLELLTHLPLLRAGNKEAKAEFLNILPKVLAHSIEHGVHIEESRQLLSYSLIHPAICGDERSQFTLWLSKLEETYASYSSSNNMNQNPNYMPRTPPTNSSTTTTTSPAIDPKLHHHTSMQFIDPDYPFSRPLGQVSGWECAGSMDSGIVANCSPESASSLSLNVFSHHKLADGRTAHNGFTPLHSTLSAPPALQSIPTSTSQDGHGHHPAMSSVNPHLSVKRTKSVTPPICVPACAYLSVGPSDAWTSHPHSLTSDTLSLTSDNSSLSPQSSISSGSGSDCHHEDNLCGSGKNVFVEGGSGMEDVPAWLKSLRLHKYAYLFQQLTYEHMLNMSEEWLEAQNVTKGARNKIILSIKKLRERQSNLRDLEKDIIGGCHLHHALCEVRTILRTPIKAYYRHKADDEDTSPTSPNGDVLIPTSPNCGGILPHGDGESSIKQGDLPGQVTRILGKVCTQILVARHLDDEGISLYLQLLDRCMSHEAFSPKQKKLISTWTQQIQKIWYPSQKFNVDKTRKSWGGSTFPLSNCARSVRQIKFPVKPAVSLWPPSKALSPTGMFLTTPHPGLTKHNSLNSYMIQSVQDAKRQLERTHSAPGCWGSRNNIGIPGESDSCTEPEINARLDSLCLSMTEHALGGLDVGDRGSTF